MGNGSILEKIITARKVYKMYISLNTQIGSHSEVICIGYVENIKTAEKIAEALNKTLDTDDFRYEVLPF